jgi:di- and tripeptidase
MLGSLATVAVECRFFMATYKGYIRWIGFYDCIRPLTSHEDALYDPIVEDMFNNPSGQRHWDPLATGVTKEELKRKLMARWRNPALTIHQVDVSGPKNRTVIPRSAKASVSMRIVPDQEVADITRSFEEYVRKVFGGLDTENEIEVRTTRSVVLKP